MCRAVQCSNLRLHNKDQIMISFIFSTYLYIVKNFAEEQAFFIARPLTFEV